MSSKRAMDTPEHNGGADELAQLRLRLERARASDRAPARLRRALERERVRAARARHRRAALGGALAAGAAAAALALALAGASPSRPAIERVAALAAHGPSLAPPPPAQRVPRLQLAAAVAGVPFPNWERLGLRAVGERRERIAGRPALTVYYQGARLLAYTIVAPPALPLPPAHAARIRGVTIWTFVLDGREVATWRRGGATCVLEGRGASAAWLRALAAWRPGSEPPSTAPPRGRYTS
jgi:hypothetical protein